MLGLREKVCGHEVGACRLVSHNHYLRGACRHIDGCALAAHHLLGLGDIAVAGAKDLVDAVDALGAIGHGGNGLGPTKFIDGMHTALQCCVEHYGVDLARGAVAWGT